VKLPRSTVDLNCLILPAPSVETELVIVTPETIYTPIVQLSCDRVCSGVQWLLPLVIEDDRMSVAVGLDGPKSRSVVT